MDTLHLHIITRYLTGIQFLNKADISIFYHLLIPLEIDKTNISYKLKEEFREELIQKLSYYLCLTRSQVANRLKLFYCIDFVSW